MLRRCRRAPRAVVARRWRAQGLPARAARLARALLALCEEVARGRAHGERVGRLARLALHAHLARFCERRARCIPNVRIVSRAIGAVQGAVGQHVTHSFTLHASGAHAAQIQSAHELSAAVRCCPAAAEDLALRLRRRGFGGGGDCMSPSGDRSRSATASAAAARHSRASVPVGRAAARPRGAERARVALRGGAYSGEQPRRPGSSPLDAPVTLPYATSAVS